MNSTYRVASPAAGASSSSSVAASGELAAHLGVTRSRTLLYQSYRDSAPRMGRGLRWSASGRNDAYSSYDADGYGQEGGNGYAGQYSSRSGHSGDAYTDEDEGDGYDDYRSAASLQRDFSNSTSVGKGKKRAGAYFDASGELREEDDERVNGQSSYPPLPKHSSIDMGALPPRWVDISDEVDSILASLQPKIAHLERLHTKHVLPGFTDRSQEERDIERETMEITREFRRCSKLIASLANNTKALARSSKASAREIAMANNVQTALATRVQDSSGAFRRKQTNYMQRLRGHEERHHDMHGGGVMRDSETALQEDMELSRQQLAKSRDPDGMLGQEQSQLLLDEQEAQRSSHDNAMISQRDREVDQIAKSIGELAELFQDLSALVIDQGTMLDRIDFNIEHMGQDMQAAVRELNDATRYQKRTSRGQCILFLVLLIFLCITLIIVKPFWRIFFPSGAPPPPIVASI